ncbi:MAG: PQQ-binding-like beta-propeller repeat protein [Sedimentisphaerales bacterium]|nr:PQQ-binding-like beta-propeller repeat protein [Sedimentisphaerales bacterium]
MPRNVLDDVNNAQGVVMLKRTIGSILLCLFGLLSSWVSAADWPQFRGPGGQGISHEKNLPVTWSDTENLVWKTPLPGFGASSPIALRGRLYITCYSGYATEGARGPMEDLTLHVVSVDAGSGNIVWDKRIQPILPETTKVRDHGYAAQTPATDGEHLYVFFGKTGVLKFDLEGNPIWQTSVGAKTHGWGSGTSPVLYENLVIVNASVESGSLVAIHKTTGKEVWRAGGMEDSWNTPHLVKTADGAQELAVSVKDWILAFDPATGRELWRCESIPDYICPSIVSQGGVLYALGGRSSKAIAVRSGGRGNVTQTHKLWQANVGANVCSPVIHEGHLYWISDRNQTAYCLRLTDGAIQYAREVGQQPYASPLGADGRIYVVTRQGGTLALAAKPQFEQLAHNRLSDRSMFNASPIAYNGGLILRSDKNLYCFKKMK